MLGAGTFVPPTKPLIALASSIAPKMVQMATRAIERAKFEVIATWKNGKTCLSGAKAGLLRAAKATFATTSRRYILMRRRVTKPLWRDADEYRVTIRIAA